MYFYLVIIISIIVIDDINGQAHLDKVLIVEISANNSKGKGIAFYENDSLYVLTMHHIIPEWATRIQGKLVNQSNQELQKELPDEMLDFYLLKFIETPNIYAPKRDKTKNLLPIFKKNRNGVLLLGNSNAPEAEIPVRISPHENDNKKFNIQTWDPQRKLEKGMSGAPIFTLDKEGHPKRLLGLLHGGPDGDTTFGKNKNVGVAHRIDWFNTELNRFFESKNKKKVIDKKVWITASVSAIASASSFIISRRKYNQAEELYSDYSQYVNQKDFLENVDGYNSREDAFIKVQDLREEAVMFRNISYGVLGTGAALVTAFIMF